VQLHTVKYKAGDDDDDNDVFLIDKLCRNAVSVFRDFTVANYSLVNVLIPKHLS